MTPWTVALQAPIHGTSQARTLEWVVIPLSRGSSWPRDWTQVGYIGRWAFYCWATWEALLKVASVVSDSVRPHRRQPTRPPRPWDSPGRNTGVGCHFLQCMKVKSESKVTQSCPTQRPHGLQPTRLLHPWDFPGKRTEEDWSLLCWEALGTYKVLFLSDFHSPLGPKNPNPLSHQSKDIKEHLLGSNSKKRGSRPKNQDTWYIRSSPDLRSGRWQRASL